jgi:hypothetical protein
LGCHHILVQSSISSYDIVTRLTIVPSLIDNA